MWTQGQFITGELITAAEWNDRSRANMDALRVTPVPVTLPDGTLTTIATLAVATGATTAKVSRRQLFGLSWFRRPMK